MLARAEFDAFAEAVAPWRSERTPAAELAAYVLWSATVRPAGFVTRPAVLMSKHWMDKVWSWDHCFNALALAVRHERDRVFVVCKNEAPLVHVFSDHLFRFPAEEPFSRHRPARHTEVAVPLDHCEGRALDVKGELLIRGLRCSFCLLARGDVSDDCDAAGDVVLLVE